MEKEAGRKDVKNSLGSIRIADEVVSIIAGLAATEVDGVAGMIIGEDEEVRVHIAAVHQDILLTFDGQESFRLLPGDEVIVRKSTSVAKIIKFDDKNFYKTVRTKLWRGDEA